MLHKIFITISIAGELLVCGCGSQANEEFPPVSFKVNDSLLTATPITFNQLQLRTPKLWLHPDSAELEEIRVTLTADSNAYLDQALESMYFAADGAAILIFTLSHDGNQLKKSLNDAYLTTLESIFQTGDIKRDQFLVNQVPVIQYMITNDQFISIKLFVFIEDGTYEIDFYIPIDEYKKQLHTVESTIGSITKHTREGP